MTGKLVVMPGSTKYGPLFVTIEITGEPGRERLSVTGVEGPKPNGDCAGSCGQVVEALSRLEAIGTGWTVEMAERLADLWERWHLNDMRAGCEHQRAAGWDKRRINESRPANSYGKHYEGQQYATWNLWGWVCGPTTKGGRFNMEWHPQGLMSEPCPTCGYQYGTKWVYEPLPTEVVEWLMALPPCELEPPAVWQK